MISLSGEPQLLGAMQAAPKIQAPLLVLIARNDGYSSVADNRRLVAPRLVEQAARRVPRGLARWDLLYHAPYRARVNALVFDFLREHSQ